MSFEPFNFSKELLEAIEQAKFNRASKIQQLVIPEILNGKDLLVSAHSGSGKSASFVLPLIQKLLNNPRHIVDDNEAFDTEEDESSRPVYGPRALILTPTRELANQVSACIRRFTRNLDLRYGILVGGAPYPPQVRMLKKPVDFLVATPGRLLDHIKNNRVNFDFVEFLVIDECNRLIDMNITNEIREIIQQLPANIQDETAIQRQTLIFTDSLEGEQIKQLSEEFQNQAVRFELARSKQSYRALNQNMYIADEGEHKFKLTHTLITSSESNNILVFSPTQERLHELSTFLLNQENFSQPCENQLILENKHIYLLNDEQLEAASQTSAEPVQIIHLDLPDDILTFLQRLNQAIDSKSEQELSILVGKDDWPLLHQIERYIGKTLTRKKIDGLEPEASEPNVASASSTHRDSDSKESQTKNRNPYSGRRQGNTSPHKNKVKEQGKSHNPSQNKRNKKTAQNRHKNPDAQPQNNFNADPFMSDRDMSWKTYISNMSNGNGNGNGNGNRNHNSGHNKGGNKNRGRNFKRQSGGFDLNNSPMAISAKTVRERANDEWIDENKIKKPGVQIRVKSYNKNLHNDHVPAGEKSYSEIEDRIEGKLGINK